MTPESMTPESSSLGSVSPASAVGSSFGDEAEAGMSAHIPFSQRRPLRQSPSSWQCSTQTFASTAPQLAVAVLAVAHSAFESRSPQALLWLQVMLHTPHRHESSPHSALLS